MEKTGGGIVKAPRLSAKTILLLIFASFLALSPIRSRNIGSRQGDHFVAVGAQTTNDSEISGSIGCRQEENFFQGLPTSYWRQRALEFHSRLKDGWAPRIVLNPDGSFDVEKPDFRIFEGDTASLAVLMDLLRDPDLAVKRSACRGLEIIGPQATPSASALIQLLIEDKSSLRPYAAEALGRIGAAAVPLLLKKLPADACTESAIFLALEKIGPDAAPAIPALSARIKDKDRGEAALSALGAIGPRSIPILISALESSDWQIRWKAALVLSDTHADPEVLVPVFVKLLKDKDGVVRQAAAAGLRKPGSAAHKAVPALIEALKDPAGYARREAIDSLGWIGGEAQAAVPFLTRMLQEETDGYMRGCIQRALKEIKEDLAREIRLL